MKIKLFEKSVKLTEGQKHVFGIYILIGWFWPNLSIRTPNMTINNTPIKAVFELMLAYTDKDIEVDELESEIKGLKKCKDRMLIQEAMLGPSQWNGFSMEDLTLIRAALLMRLNALGPESIGLGKYQKLLHHVTLKAKVLANQINQYGGI